MQVKGITKAAHYKVEATQKQPEKEKLENNQKVDK